MIGKVILALLLFSVPLFGQSSSISGSHTDAASTCGTTNCTKLSLPPNVGSLTVELTGTWEGTQSFESTIDWINWSAAYGYPAATGTLVESATANGRWQFLVAGMVGFRVRESAFTSGTCAVSISASPSAGISGGGAVSVSGITQYASGVVKGTETGTIASWSDGTNIWPASTAKPFPIEITSGGIAAGTVASPSTDVLTVQLPNTDPCQTNAKVVLPINNTTSAVELIALSGTTKVYICSIFLVSATAQNINLLEGTKTSTECDTAAAGLLGGATAATGPNLAANTGFTLGNGGYTVAATATAGHDVCFFSSSTGQVSGVITYVQK
jgi:hypothetical protein